MPGLISEEVKKWLGKNVPVLRKKHVFYKSIYRWIKNNYQNTKHVVFQSYTVFSCS
jgi:hypothetical protein